MTLDELEAMCKMHIRCAAGNVAWDLSARDLEAGDLILKLCEVARAAQSLMSEDDAREAVAHYNCLHILADKLKELA